MAATAGERLRAQNRALVALARSDALRSQDFATYFAALADERNDRAVREAIQAQD